VSDTLPSILSIISNDQQSELSVTEAIKLDNILRWIRACSSGVVALHHGCSTEINSADMLGHRFAWDYGWRIVGHPACGAGGEPRLLTHVRKQLSLRHRAQRLGDRDARLIRVADIIVAIRPRLRQTKDLLDEAAALGCQVILIDAPGPERPTVPAQAESVEKIDWTPRIHNYLVDEHR
jgi:hypothetical protein